MAADDDEYSPYAFDPDAWEERLEGPLTDPIKHRHRIERSTRRLKHTNQYGPGSMSSLRRSWYKLAGDPSEVADGKRDQLQRWMENRLTDKFIGRGAYYRKKRRRRYTRGRRFKGRRSYYDTYIAPALHGVRCGSKVLGNALPYAGAAVSFAGAPEVGAELGGLGRGFSGLRLVSDFLPSYQVSCDKSAFCYYIKTVFFFRHQSQN